MYDYIRTLQKQFEPTPEFFQNLDGDIRQIHKQLSARLEPEDRKLLLKLVDMEDLLHSEARLHSFISGYRLALQKTRCMPSKRTRSSAGYSKKCTAERRRGVSLQLPKTPLRLTL